MAMPEMPNDWNDHPGWDRYYRELCANPADHVRWAMMDAGMFASPESVAELHRIGWRDIWVPGCGISPLPSLLARAGFNVIATDLSPVAVAFQQNYPAGLLPEDVAAPVAGGSLTAEIHDFRTDFGADRFDLLLNVKSYQAFPVADLPTIAATHARALRAGRRGFFATMNVQGDRRDVLETALETGGFVVPFAEVHRWHRAALRDTGLPFVFILGRPMIPFTGEYADEKKRAEGMARLAAIDAEFQRRADAAKAAEQARITPATKIATVIYNTG